jgi:hypothetical protein
MGAPGGRPSVKGGIPGGVRGQADRSYPAGLRRLWRYDEEGALTNIRTPNHLVLPRMLLALPAAPTRQIISTHPIWPARH